MAKSKESAKAATPPAAASTSNGKRTAAQMSDEELEAAVDGHSGARDVGTPDIQGWYKPESKSVVYGKIVGAIGISQEERGVVSVRSVVLIELERACDAIMDKEEITMDPGQVLGLSVSAKLTELLHYVEGNGVVYIKPLEKVALKGGRSMWKFKVKILSGKRSATPFNTDAAAMAQDYTSGSAAVDEGDAQGVIPF